MIIVPSKMCEKKMNNGHYIPLVGLGTSKSPNIGEIVELAIDAGYRHFDCAWIYGNEADVGKAIKRKIKQNVIKRDDIFITTKLWNNFHRRQKVVEMLQNTLKAMKLLYIDLFLIHWPLGFKETAKTVPFYEGSDAYSNVDFVETWKGMEDCVDCGFARSIGLANFNSQQIQRILRFCKIKPVVNQIEVHSEFQQKKLIEFCQNQDIVVVAYCPLGINELGGTSGLPERTIDDEKIHEIGRKHHKTAAQVVLNYLVSRGICVIPKSFTKFRIVEHFDIFDFHLDSDDIKYLESCERNHRISPFAAFVDHMYYPFHLEY